MTDPSPPPPYPPPTPGQGSFPPPGIQQPGGQQPGGYPPAGASQPGGQQPGSYPPAGSPPSAPSTTTTTTTTKSGGMAGMVADPSTLAATGLIAAVLFAIVAGLIAVLGDPGPSGTRGRLLNLTNTVDVGDVALLGLAVALLLLTPDPPGGLARPLLLQLTALLAAIISVYAVVRALTIVSSDTDAAAQFAGFIATVGVGIAAATIAFYAAKESFLKKEGRI
jgi:hypothetical protein